MQGAKQSGWWMTGSRADWAPVGNLMGGAGPLEGQVLVRDHAADTARAESYVIAQSASYRRLQDWTRVTPCDHG